MSNTTLSVSAIKNGCVIDHIPTGHAAHILNGLHLNQHDCQMTIGLNLPSKRSGSKDILKIEGRQFTQAELNKVAIFAASATISTIQDFTVVDKSVLSLPDNIIDVMHCPNSTCITNREPIKSHFILIRHGQDVKMKCRYCEASYTTQTMYGQL